MTPQPARTQEPSTDILLVRHWNQVLLAEMGSGSADTALIAIVDNDRWMRSSLERLLKSAGFRTKSFASAEDYLDAGDRGVLAASLWT
jgi:hypothetical protein